jgi:hypothetical protein
VPTPEEEALAVAKAAAGDAEGGCDWELFQAEYETRLAERHKRLMTDARAVFRALEGWGTVKTQEDWEQTVQQAYQDFGSGRFLIDRLGGERFVDPPLMAVLITLRRRLIAEHGATTAAELMIIDSAVLSYYHLLRINGWIGNMAIWLESEFFRKESLSAKLKGYYGADTVRGLRVEDIVSQLVERLMPLLDRSSRMMLRNLKALRERRQEPLPSVNIGNAGQVNVGAQQVNVAEDTSDQQSPRDPSGARVER